RFHYSDDEEMLAQAGNVADASFRTKFPSETRGIKADDGYAFTAPVGKFQPNKFGLYDMHGNAWEWCQDCYDENYYKKSPRKDPQGPDPGAGALRVIRVIRGGSWDNQSRYCRSAYRSWCEPSVRDCLLGFRVVRVR